VITENSDIRYPKFSFGKVYKAFVGCPLNDPIVLFCWKASKT